ncbi:hypothetical protein D049_0084B, partial [Vibrio parahaemolyticus VPTS-2010]
TALRSQ